MTSTYPPLTPKLIHEPDENISLPGADRIALKTGARVIANPESIRLLRDAGVPETQLITVAGGERVPLFTKSTWQDLAAGKCATSGPNLPGAPPRPDPSLAVMAVDVWPSLHCLMSIGAHPDEFDLGNEEPTPKNEWKSTLDISYGMKWGLSRLDEILPPQAMQNPGVKALVDYFHDEGNKYSHCDGGQLMYNLRWGGEALDERVVLWNGHMGAYEGKFWSSSYFLICTAGTEMKADGDVIVTGIMKTVHPQPQIAILGAAGEVNLNGRPYKGTAAEFLRSEVEWLGHPERVMWCLHDERCRILLHLGRWRND